MSQPRLIFRDASGQDHAIKVCQIEAADLKPGSIMVLQVAAGRFISDGEMAEIVASFKAVLGEAGVTNVPVLAVGDDVIPTMISSIAAKSTPPSSN